MKNYLISIVGPTASGKTSLGIQIANHFNCEIVSADSRQFFQEMPIGTAQPNSKELLTIKHHFIGNLSVHQEMNVGKFEKMALEKLTELFAKNPIQVMVGGSGLYVQAVCEGFDDLPEKNTRLRADLQMEFEKFGISVLQDSLKNLDPEFFKKVDSNNPQRLMRAIEICIGSGKTHAELKLKKINPRNFEVIKIGIDLERNLLYSRINQRVDQMMDQGLLQEAKNLLPYKHLGPLQTVGYKELFDFFEGKMNLEKAVDQIKQHTRNFAKRQLTWFRKDPQIKWWKGEEDLKIILENLPL